MIMALLALVFVADTREALKEAAVVLGSALGANRFRRAAEDLASF